MKILTPFIFVMILLLIVISINNSFSQWYPQGPNSLEYRLNDLEIIDDQHGWVVGDGGSLLKTINGGLTWVESSIEIAGEIQDLLAISFINLDSGLVSTSEGAIVKTINGGIDWQVIKDADGYDLPFLYYYGDKAYAGGWDRILKMTGDENLWEDIDIGTFQEYTLTDFQFINDSTGWFCIEEIQGMGSWYAAIGRTTDGFENWESVTFDWYGYFKAFFLDIDHGWVSGLWENYPNGLYKTVNGGNSYSFSFNIRGHNMFFVSMNIGWITNDETIYGYRQNNWSQQYTGNCTFKDIQFIDDQKGWCIGNKTAAGSQFPGRIFYTQNGGYVNTNISDNAYNSGISSSPNPFSDFISINGIPNEIKELTYSVTSLNNSTQLLTGTLRPDKNFDNIRVDLSSLPKGVYLITIDLTTKSESFKIIKL